MAGFGDFQVAQAQQSAVLQYRWPYNKKPNITAPFGQKRNASGTHNWRWHLGIDLQSVGGRDGSPIYSTTSGVISYVGWDDPGNHRNGMGWCVKIDHDTDPYSSWYGHMREQALQGIYIGAYVAGGQQIGNQGNTGSSTGDHLHFQVNAFQASSGVRPNYTSTIENSNCFDPIYLLTNGEDNSGKHGGTITAANIPRNENGEFVAVANSGSYDNTAVSLYNLSIGGSKLLSPSNDEKKYGIAVYDTVQSLIRGTTAGAVAGSGNVFDALSRYAKYIYNYLNSSVSVASFNVLSMPWIRPGFNLWFDPLFVDRVYYVTSVQHVGSKQNGVFTTIGCSFGRNRQKFQKQSYEFGSLKPGNPDNVFINSISVPPSSFSRNLLASSADFDALRKKVLDYYNSGDASQNVMKAAFHPFYQYLYNTINTEAGTVTGAYQSPAIGTQANTVNDIIEQQTQVVSRSAVRFDGIFKRNDIVVATGLAYRTSKGKGPAVQLNNVRGALTVTDGSSSDPYPYYFANRGWMAKSSLQFVSREETVTETITKYASPAATKEFDSVGEIQKWLDSKYQNAPTVIKNRITRHKKIIASAEAYIKLHYVREG